MVELRLYAIAIDDVRDMFGAGSDLAGRLRTIASERFRVPEQERRRTAGGFLGKVGPLFRHDRNAPIIPDGIPLPGDVENLLKGRFVTPERINESWLVVQTWLDELCWERHLLHVSRHEFDKLEFDLARAGLSSRYGIGNLMSLDANLTLRPAWQMTIGYAKHAHMEATRDAIRKLDDPVATTNPLLIELRSFLGRSDEWAAQAEAHSRPAPDIFGIRRDDL